MLMELLEKNFIYISSSSAIALVLFTYKLGGGLWFYINYHTLNVIMKKD
jgi:hypothetical protein